MAEHFENLKRGVMNLFKKNDLPMAMHSGTAKNNGVALSSVNKYVASSLLWLLVSLYLVYYGWGHCGYYSLVSSLDCVDGTCTLDLRLSPDDTKVHTFLAQDFIESTTVRINEDGNVAGTSGLSRKEQGKLGHSVQLKFKSAPEEGSRFKVQQTTLFSSANLGKRPARTMNNKINGFIDNKDKSKESFSITAGSRVTVVGVLSIAFGVISTAAALLFGHWSDPTPRRLRKVQ
mmetsp:Transcript_15450/g.25727  ORF Transcript_15450/g.25727 Transcript_15450/m.25727 type:complete len:232 (-) Transcript_15450:1996-2691(-)